MFNESENTTSAELLLQLINKFKTVFTGRTSQSAHPGAIISVIIDNRSVTAKACTSITPGSVSVLKTTTGDYLAFTESTTYQSRAVTPYFRRNRQVNRRYIAEVESSTNKTPVLFTNKEEIKVPILFSENKKEYGNVGVLFAKFKTYDEDPFELCKCKKYQALQGECVEVCNQDGEFETLEDCNQFRGNATGGSITNYYAIANHNAGFNPGKPPSNWRTWGEPAWNAYTVFTVGGVAIERCLDILFTTNELGQTKYALTQSNYKHCGLLEYPNVKRWLGVDGNTYSDSEVILYFVGVWQWYDFGMTLELRRNYYSYDNTRIGNQGFATGIPQYPPPTGGQVFIHMDIDYSLGSQESITVECEGQGSVVLPPETRLGYIRWFAAKGKLNGYQSETLTFNPPPLPTRPRTNSNTGKYLTIEYYLGGDRREPLKLGEYYIDNTYIDYRLLQQPFTETIPSKLTQGDIPDSILRKFNLDGNLLYPSWFKYERGENDYQYTFKGNEHEKIITNIYQSLIGDSGNFTNGNIFTDTLKVVANIVRLSEFESEVCIKYGVVNTSRYEVGSRANIANWCHIDIIKVNKGSVSKTTYKHPETVTVDVRNLTAPWCTNWLYAKESTIGNTYYGSEREQLNYFGGEGDRELTTICHYSNWKRFLKPEIAQYLKSNLETIKSSVKTQHYEVFSTPASKSQLGLYGINFRIIGDKLYATDVIPHQPVKVIATRHTGEKEYITCLGTAIKYKDVEAYIRFGETERTAPSDYTDMHNSTTVRSIIETLVDQATFMYKTYKTAKTKIFKIPEDVVILEISPYIEPSKIEDSTILLPDIKFTSFLATIITDTEGIGIIYGATIRNTLNWVNSHIPKTRSTVLYQEYTTNSILNKYYKYYRAYFSYIELPSDNNPFVFKTCNNITTEYPFEYQSIIYGVPIIEGFCE